MLLPRLVARFWDRMNVMVRLLFVLVICMIIALVGAAYQSAHDATFMVQRTLETKFQDHMDMLESLVRAAIISDQRYSDPLDRLRVVLTQGGYNPEVVHLSFRDTSDVVSISYDRPFPLKAPNWFSRWCGLEEISGNRALVIEGLYYGVLSLTMSPNDGINKAWENYVRQLRIFIIAFVLVWVSVSWVLHQGLRPLKSLAKAYHALGRGELSTRLEVRGSPEMQISLANFNDMALNIEIARDELRASEERFRVLIEHAPEAIVVYDLDLDRFVDANSSAETLFGYGREELLKIDPRLFFAANRSDHPVDYEFFMNHMEKLAKGEKVVSEQSIYYAKGGKRVCSIHLAKLPDERKKLIRASFIDITDRKQAEDALRVSEERYRTLLQTAMDGFLMVDLQERILEVNETYCRMSGYHHRELLTLSLNDIIAPEMVDTIRARMQMIISKGEGRFETRHRHKDGSVFDVEASVQYRPIEDGRIVAFIRDITERKQWELEQDKLQTHLRQAQKMEAIGTLAGGVAHDFNNLLQAINGYTQLLLLDKSDGDPEYDSLKAIQVAGFRASELVRQLLLFSRKESPTRKRLQLQHEVEQTRKILERTIPKMVEIRIITGDRLWTVDADPVQIEQMLLNLGTNAADAMPEGGRLFFEIENVIIKNDYANLHFGVQPGPYVLLTVSDTGHGIEKDTLEHIFDPFFTTKEFGKGTGLGLASVYGIVQSHGAYINCYSEVGKGTTFKIYFPATEGSDIDEAKEVAAKPMPGGSETILLVDDEEAIRDFAQQALTKFGYRVMAASTGEEALEIYRQASDAIDLIVTDIGMPGMGGHKFLRELLLIKPTAKVIIASGYSFNGQVKKSLEIGAKIYVGKPYQLADLLNKVRAVLDSGK